MKSETNIIKQPKIMVLKDGVDESVVEGLLQPIMELADGYFQDGKFSFDEKTFYSCWLDALNDFSWDGDPDDPKQQEAIERQRNLSLKLVKAMKDNEQLPEDFRKQCADLIDKYVTEKDATEKPTEIW